SPAISYSPSGIRPTPPQYGHGATVFPTSVAVKWPPKMLCASHARPHCWQITGIGATLPPLAIRSLRRKRGRTRFFRLLQVTQIDRATAIREQRRTEQCFRVLEDCVRVTDEH